MPDIVKVTITADCDIPGEGEAEVELRRRLASFLPRIRSTGFPRAEIESISFGNGEPEPEEAPEDEPAEDLSDLSFDELYARAQDQDIAGRSSMNKTELVEALS